MSIRDILCAWLCPEPVQPIEPSFKQQATTDRISSLDIVKMFGNTSGVVINGNDLHITDRTFKLVDIDHMVEFLKDNPVSKRKYVKGKHDCDDYAYILQGDVTRWDSDLAFGIIHGLTPSGDGHAWNVCVGNDRELWFIEPQDDSVWKPTDFWDIWLVVM